MIGRLSGGARNIVGADFPVLLYRQRPRTRSCSSRLCILAALRRADVDEDVVVAFIRLNESELFWLLNHLLFVVMGSFLHSRVKSKPRANDAG